MNRFRLDHYFGPNGRGSALGAYSRFADERGWPVSEKIRLYVASRQTFDSGGTAESRGAQEAFNEIYASLSSMTWGAFRSSKPGPHWPAKKILKVLGRDFSGFAWGDGLALMNTLDARQQRSLMAGLDSIRGIKSKQSYPLMTVSKFLHFFNPSLFPIYDSAIFENWVLVKFDRDYKKFCKNAGLDYGAAGAKFFVNYVQWAASLVQAAGPGFMTSFVDWRRDEVSPRQYRGLPSDLYLKLYAAAFEFTAIGATKAEEDRAKPAN